MSSCAKIACKLSVVSESRLMSVSISYWLRPLDSVSASVAAARTTSCGQAITFELFWRFLFSFEFWLFFAVVSPMLFTTLFYLL